MRIDDLVALWTSYRATKIDQTLHSLDRMHFMNPDLEAYLRVGESGASVLFSGLTAAPTQEVKRVLDFGCGHGRIARHIQAMFPRAERFFLDADPGAAAFCAKQFGGVEVPASTDFDALTLPGSLDLIWLGSVITHTSHERTVTLMNKLADALAPDGVIIATVHGPFAITRHSMVPMIDAERWEQIIESYKARGIGWAQYPGRSGQGEWGLSLMSPTYVREILADRKDVTFAAHLDRAWANFHDVGVWAKRPNHHTAV